MTLRTYAHTGVEMKEKDRSENDSNNSNNRNNNTYAKIFCRWRSEYEQATMPGLKKQEEEL